MALPKLNTPTHKLVLPSTNEEVKFRPFLVKEQKLLLMAQQSDDKNEINDAIIDIIKGCTGLDAENLPMYDVEYIFLKLRAKSVGDIIEINLLCADDGVTRVPTKIDLNDIEVMSSVDHDNIIQLTDDIKLVMSYPTMKDMKDVNILDTNINMVFDILKNCISEVHNGDEIVNRVDIKKEELSEFIDSLNNAQFDKLMTFFNTMPKVRHVVEIKNPKTKKKNEVLLEGLQSFLG